MILALLLSTEVFAKKKRKVGKIKRKDRRIMKNRVESKSFDFISFGPSWFYSLDRTTNRNAAFQLGAGKLWEVNPNAAVKFRTDIAVSPEFNQFLGGIGLGSNYYFNASDFSPFIGGDLGMGYFYNNEQAKSENQENSSNYRDPDAGFGFMFGFSGGVVLFRTSDTHLLVEPNLQWQLRGSYPMTLGLKLSIASTGLFSSF